MTKPDDLIRRSDAIACIQAEWEKWGFQVPDSSGYWRHTIAPLQVLAAAHPTQATNAALERTADAVRHSFDGHGWLYADQGNGSDWLERAMKMPDAEPLYQIWRMLG